MSHHHHHRRPALRNKKQKHEAPERDARLKQASKTGKGRLSADARCKKQELAIGDMVYGCRPVLLGRARIERRHTVGTLCWPGPVQEEENHGASKA
jgi:hypothetical protein